MLTAVDNCIDLLSQGKTTPGEAACTAVIFELLARRQVFLDQHSYRQHGEQKTDLLAKIRILVLTPTKLAGFRNGDSEWNCLFDAKKMGLTY